MKNKNNNKEGNKSNRFELTATLFLNAFKNSCGKHRFITGGTIWDFIRESRVVYSGGKCPVYYIEHLYNGEVCTIGSCYASNGKPRLEPFYKLDNNLGNM